jgi:Skp family chaperone for outer membrane proteins
MSNARRITFLVAAAITGLASISALTSATAQVQPPTSNQPLKIGVVDLGKLGDGLLEAADINKKLVSQAEEMQKRLDEVTAQLRKVSDDLQLIADHNSEEYLRKWGEAAELDVQVRARKQALEKAFDQQKGMVTATMYARMAEGITLWADQEKYDLVMVDDRATLPFGDLGSEVARQMITSRQVLFASPRMDVTSQVTTFMNNRFSAGIRSHVNAPLRNPQSATGAPAATGATGAPAATSATGVAPAPTGRPAGVTGATGGGH